MHVAGVGSLLRPVFALSPGDGTQAARLGGKRLYLLSYLTGPF